MTEEALDLFQSLACSKAVEAVELAGDGTDRAMLAAAMYFAGAQFGLELALLSPGAARRLILAMHDSQPDGKDKWNKNAMQFIERLEPEQ